MTARYTERDVLAVKYYMTVKRHTREGHVPQTAQLKGELKQVYERGQSLIAQVLLKYTKSESEAAAAQKDSPAIRSPYVHGGKIENSWYWLVARKRG